MDFGDILDNWESEKNKISSTNKKKKETVVQKKSHVMDDFLNSYAPDQEVLGTKIEEKTYEHSVSHEKMKRKKADLILDLHGMTADEAKMELSNFIRNSYKSGAKKILIIHGKGNHTQGRAVLKPLVRSLLEISPYIGDVGTAIRRDGGGGATWAVVRQRSL